MYYLLVLDEMNVSLMKLEINVIGLGGDLQLLYRPVLQMQSDIAFPSS